MQPGYEWIDAKPQPKHLAIALSFLGVEEIVGKQHNGTILQWAEDLGLKRVYSNDEIPWCGLYTGKVMKEAGFEIPAQPLWALNWQYLGTKVPGYIVVKRPGWGDIIVYKRLQGGHVGFYIGEDAVSYHTLGGNQSNKVSITRILKDRAVAFRRPVYENSVSAEVIKLAKGGIISTNEA